LGKADEENPVEPADGEHLGDVSQGLRGRQIVTREMQAEMQYLVFRPKHPGFGPGEAHRQRAFPERVIIYTDLPEKEVIVDQLGVHLDHD